MKVIAVRHDGKKLEIEIEDKLLELLKKEPFEYRVSTDCAGSVIAPIELKPPKEDDYVVDLGDKRFYISSTQALWLRKITLDMFRGLCSI
jgi:hypothetical protein